MKTLPYADSSAGQSSAMADIQKHLKTFECDRFAFGEDNTGEVFVQFSHRGRAIEIKASARGYAAAWLKARPYTLRMKLTLSQYEAKALAQGNVAVWSILRDWIKSQLTAVECGLMTFDGAFLSHMLLPDGRRVLDHVPTILGLPEQAGH